jgi:methylmalonyl-CoA mutase N-terminal domain/subunit
MEEVGLRDTVDPLAGSYFIETLTKEMEEKITNEMHRVKKMGGMVQAVSSGYIQREVAKQAYAFEKSLQNGDVIKVGVNKYTGGEQPDVDLHEYDDTWADTQVQRLKTVRRTRNNREVVRLLKDLDQAARTDNNVMPTLVDCCRAYATVGEMAGVLRDVFGEWDEPSLF